MMTKDEIKKAFDICCSVQDCTGCPILTLEKQNGRKCKYNLFVSVINLITEQEKEIEKLKNENTRLTTKLGQVLLSIDTVKEMNTMCSIDEQRKQAQIDVLNELKKKIHDTRLNDDTAEIIIEMIEELKKCRR